MKHTSAELAARLTIDSFSRSASYDAVWMLENGMGPNPVWLAEALSPGARWVLPAWLGARDRARDMS